MQSNESPFRFRATLPIALAFLIAATGLARDASKAEFVPSGAKADVVGPGECSECHESETAVWQASTHYTGSKTLSRNDRAREIAQALGIKRLKNDARCTQCHFTVQVKGDKDKAISGPSCESCHGSAAPWIDLHNEFGGADVEPADETDAHRKQRLEACDQVGMIRPGRIFDLAVRCQTCHTIGDRELVETGGHPAQTEFEFVAWSQGEVRHNFVSSGPANQSSAPERLRLMYVLGHAAGLAAALQAIEDTNTEGAFASAMRTNARTELEALAAIQAAAPTAEIEALLTAVKLEFESADSAQLAAAAAYVKEAARAFEAAHDGKALAGIDSLLPTTMRSGN